MICYCLTSVYLCPLFFKDCVAQLVEHYTFNVVVLGSSPSAVTSNIETPAAIGCGDFLFKEAYTSKVLLNLKRR
jgi:hypothetical protein